MGVYRPIEMIVCSSYSWDMLPLCIVVVDSRGGVVYVGKRGLDVLGVVAVKLKKAEVEIVGENDNYKQQ